MPELTIYHQSLSTLAGTIYNRILKTGGWPTPWTKSLFITQCSPDERKHGRMGQNNSWSKTRMSSVTTLFSIFLEQIMSDALIEHYENITSLRFADDIDALAEEEHGL